MHDTTTTCESCETILEEKQNQASYKVKKYEELIFKTGKSDEAAFEELYNIAHKIVFAYILSITKNYFNAQDILQDTFIKIRCNASKYRPNQNPLGWILKIARNQALMCFRWSKREGSIPEDKDGKVIDIESYTDFDSRVLLEGALKILNQKQKAVVLMHAVSGFKHREIAKILDLPLGTVLSCYNEAIKKLRTQILGKEESI